MSLALLAATLMIPLPLGAEPKGPDLPPALERALFEAAIMGLLAEDRNVPLRVERRPLQRDPRLVTLHVRAPVPGQSGRSLDGQTFAEVVPHIESARLEVLATLHLEATEGFPVYDCPSAIMPFRTAAEMAEARRGCPPDSFRIAALSLGRPGGAHWPPYQDWRSRYQGREVWSVRVIIREYGPHGLGPESSMDLVFERQVTGWILLERARFLIVE